MLTCNHSDNGYSSLQRERIERRLKGMEMKSKKMEEMMMMLNTQVCAFEKKNKL